MRQLGALLLLVLLSIGSASAQTPEARDSEPPYQTLRVWAGPIIPADSRLAEFWSPQPGAEVGASTEFYVGRLVGGIRLSTYTGASGRPDFDAFSARVGWEDALVRMGPLSLSAGGHIGTLRMAFDDASEAGIRNESELLLGVSAGARVRLTEWAALGGSWSRERVYTQIPLDLDQWTVHLAVSFDTPRWLRRILE